MPSSRPPSTASNSASSPASWPWVRFSPRRRAHRPFPSMTTATWRGMREASRSDGSTELDRNPPGRDGLLADREFRFHPGWSVARDVAVEDVRPRFGVERAGGAPAGSDVELLELRVPFDDEVVLDSPHVLERDRHGAGRCGDVLRRELEVGAVDGDRRTAAPTASGPRCRAGRVDDQLPFHARLPVAGDVAVVGVRARRDVVLAD